MRYVQIALFGMAVAVALAACAPFEARDLKNSPSQENLTGKIDPATGGHHTTGNDPRVHEYMESQLKQEANNKAQIKKDQALAGTIFGVKFSTTNEEGELTQKNPSNYEMKLQVLQSDRLQWQSFAGDIEVDSTAKAVELKPVQIENDNFIFEVSGVCTDPHCLDKIEIDFVKKSTKGKKLATAKLFGRNFWTKARVRKSRLEDPSQYSAALREQHKQLEQIKHGWNTNWVVAPSGISTYSIRAFADNSSAEDNTNQDKIAVPSGGLEIAEFSGDSLRTDERAFPIEVEPRDVPFQGEAETIGNQEDGDGKSLKIELKDDDGNTSEVIVEFYDEEKPTDTEIKQPTPPQAGEAYFKAPTREHPQAQSIALDLEQNYNMPKVQEWIERWSSGSYRSQMESFMRYAYGVKEITEAVFLEKRNIPPALAVISLIESGGFWAGSYLKQKNPKSSAFGPFQILKATAQDYGLKVSPPYSEQDERGYYATAACGAANYLNHLQGLFGHADSTLILVAYHLGQGNLFKIMEGFDYTFKEIVERRIQIGTDKINYVAKILGAYFVLNNPGAYGFNIEEIISDSPAKPKNVLPQNTIYDDRCRQVVIPFTETLEV